MARRLAQTLSVFGLCAGLVSHSVALATPINWVNAAGGSWGDPANWSPASVPGSSDDAILSLPGSYTVTKTGNATVNLIDVGSVNTTLWIRGSGAGGFTTLTSSTGINNSGTLLLESIDGGYDSNLALSTGILTNSGTIQTNLGTGGARNLTASITNTGTINAGADTTLFIPAAGKTFNQNAGSINGTGLFLMDGGVFNFNGGSTTGRVDLRGAQLNVTANAVVPSTIVVTGSPTLLGNAATNVTVWVQGSDIGSHTSLNLPDGSTNNGIIRMESINGGYYSVLTLAGGFTNSASGIIQVNPGTGGPRSITGHLINAGAVNVDPASPLTISGSYTAAGGSLNGPAYLLNVALDETASSASPTTIVTTGGSSTLTSNNLANTTLWIQGGGLGQHTLVTTPGSFSNAGTLRMESVDGGYFSNLSLTSGAISNSGVIQVNPGSGGSRTLTGGVTNAGTINVASGTSLSLIATGRTVNQNAGTISAPGQLVMDNGLFNFNGGATSGGVYLRNSQLNVAASVTTPSTIFVTGPTPSLLNNASPNVTVWIQGNGIGSHTVCGTVNGATNAGTIRMESADGGYYSQLAITGDFTNTASGVIQVKPGTGGPRLITGHLINAGAVNVDNGALLTIPDHYTAAGGSLNGPAYLVNAILDETASPALPTTIMATGNSLTLASNNLFNTTLWVQGSGLGGHTTLTSANSFSNAGTIRLEPLDGGYSCNLTLTTGTLSNSGTIKVGSPFGGPRVITGSVTNTGTIRVDSGITLNIAAANKVFNQNAGLITSDGTFLMDDGAFNFNGGATSGGVYLRNSQLNVAAGVTTPSTIYVTGPSVSMVNNASPNVTVWVQGNGLGGFTTLNLAGTTSNAGTLRLESLDGGYSCNVTLASGTLNNSGTIQSNVGFGGSRVITGDVNNTGTIGVSTNAGLNITGNLLNNSGATLTGGQYIVAGTFAYNNALINTNAANIVLDGPSSAITNQSSANALANLGSITSVGALALQNGRNFSIGSAIFSNAGQLALSSSSTLSALDSFTQTSTGNLSVQIGGLVPGTNASRVTASGVLNLGGSLTVKMTNGFAPALNDSIQIMSGVSRTGVFSNLNQLEACGGKVFNIVYGATDVRLVAAASPFPMGDLNHDNVVNVADAVILANVLAGADTDYLHQIRSDVNCDGIANGTDIQVFMHAMIP